MSSKSSSTEQFIRAYLKGRQVAPEADLSPLIPNATIAAPPHGLVESDSSLVAFYGPHYRLIVAVRNQITQSDRHQCLANTCAPVRRTDGDSVKFAEARIHWISAGANADESCNRTHTLSYPPTMWDRLSKITVPAFSKGCRHSSIGL